MAHAGLLLIECLVSLCKKSFTLNTLFSFLDIGYFAKLPSVWGTLSFRFHTICAELISGYSWELTLAVDETVGKIVTKTFILKLSLYLLWANLTLAVWIELAKCNWDLFQTSSSFTDTFPSILVRFFFFRCHSFTSLFTFWLSGNIQRVG